MNITVLTQDLETLTSRRMLLDLIEMDKDFFNNKKEKLAALRACTDIWKHELVNDSPEVAEATRRLVYQKLSRLKDRNVLAFPG